MSSDDWKRLVRAARRDAIREERRRWIVRALWALASALIAGAAAWIWK